MFRKPRLTLLAMRAILLVAGVLSPGAGSARDAQQKDQQLIDIARSYLATHFQNMGDILQRKPSIYDLKEFWVVAFLRESPPGALTIGGGPEVLIDKNSLKVVETQWSQ